MSTNITSVYVLGFPKSPLGTVKTSSIPIEKGPTKFDLMAANQDYKTVEFWLNYCLGTWAGPYFSRLRKLEFHRPRLANIDWEIVDRGFDPHAHLVDFWVFHKHGPGNLPYPKALFHSDYWTGSPEARGRGFVKMEELWLRSLNEIYNLPGLRWCRNLCDVLQISKVTISRQVELIGVTDHVVGDRPGKKLLPVGEYRANLSLTGDTPWVVIDARRAGWLHRGCSLLNLILDEDVRITWMHERGRTAKQ